MFGRVIPNKAELKVREEEIYRSYYCGLCHALFKKGPLTSLSLNYDMTFLSLLLNSLYESGTKNNRCRCICHMCKKHPETSDSYTGYVSHMTIILSYYKCLDDYKDDKNIIKGLYAFYLGFKVKKLCKKYPCKHENIKTLLKELSNAEKTASLEECATLFGNILSEVFTPEEDLWADILSRLGFYLGKFIYIADAYEDIEEDIKKNRPNPLKSMYSAPEFHSECHTILNMMAAQAAEEFERLPLVENVEILRNIIYSGIWQKIEGAKE